MQRKELEVTDDELVMICDALTLHHLPSIKANVQRRELLARLFPLLQKRLEEQAPRKPCCTPPKWCPDCKADRDHEVRKD